MVQRIGATPGDVRPWASETKAVFKLGGMLALTQLTAVALTTTDIAFAGRLGPTYLAAEVIASSAIFPIFLFAQGVLAALTAMIAQDLGAHRKRGVRRSLRQGFWVAMTISVPFMAAMWHGETLLLWLGQDAALAALGGPYMQAVIWSFFPHFGYIILRSFIAGHSRPRAAVVIMIAGFFVNAAGNYLLMFGAFGLPRLELVGLGLSTSFAHWFMFAALLGFCLVDRQFRRYGILVRLWRADWPRFREIFRIGLPVGFGYLAESGMFAVAGFLIGIIDAGALSGHAVALQVSAILFMIPFGMAQASTVRVGLAVGGGHFPRARVSGWCGLALTVGTALASAAVLLLFGGEISALFLDAATSDGAAAIAPAASFLAVAAAFQLVDGLQAVAAGALRGYKDTAIPMVIQVIGYWGIGAGAMAALGFFTPLAGIGVWTGMALGLAAVAVALIWRFHRLSRRPPGAFAALGEAV